MTPKHRETIEVGEYVDAFRTWALLHPRFGDEERAAIEAGCAYLTAKFSGEESIDRLCRYFHRWSIEHDSYLMDRLRTAVLFSHLLVRLIYRGEPLRMQRCPIHDGHHGGRFQRCPAGCNAGTHVTGWLPRLPESGVPSTEELRAHILREADAAYDVRAPSAVRAGMSTAMDTIRAQPLHADPRLWLWRVREALDEVHAAFEDARDADGWALGGLATVRQIVEAAHRALVG